MAVMPFAGRLKLARTGGLAGDPEINLARKLLN
jgi:hypothetical protein